jgi:ATP-binding cassette subfamily B multidrug efflux pump
MLSQLFRLLRKHLRNYKRELGLVVLFQFLQTVATLYLPNLNASIIDKGVIGPIKIVDGVARAVPDHHYIWSHGTIMLVVAFLQVCFNVVAVYYGSKAAMGFGRDVRQDLFETVTAYSAREVAGFGAPSLITRITNDVQQVQMLVQMTCTLLVAAPIMVVGGVIMALREDIGLSAMLIVAVPVLLFIVGNVVWRMVPQFQVIQERIDRVNQILREQITGIRVVRAFVREPDEAERFAGANRQLTAASLANGRLMAILFPAVLLVLNVSSAAAVWIGGSRIQSGQMQVGAMIAFLSYLIQILMSLMMATFMAVLAPRAAVCADRIMEVLDTPTSVAEPDAPVFELLQQGVLELRDVGYHYPGAAAPVLDGITFTARAGETTAIIGSTGAGKTTLLNLVPRLFDVTSGAVLVNGVDVRELDMHVLWEQIGLVPQRPYLFSGTIASNLRYGDPDATDEDLWAALEIAQARDFVSSMPGGLAARIDQGGTNVSGGQRQRLAIARALVRKPGIYLFDDSFSALDLATDARLRAALEPHTREAAVIIVAQRVSTIIGADQILVLEDGVAVGLGRHHELLETCPTYAEIVESQMSKEEAA